MPNFIKSPKAKQLAHGITIAQAQLLLSNTCSLSHRVSSSLWHQQTVFFW